MDRIDRKSVAVGLGCRLALLLTALFPALLRGAETNDPCLECDREMRKTFESIQAWRRLHNGAYPERLVDLKTAGLMPDDGAICPEVLREGAGASAAHQATSSRGHDRDPSEMYEYDMSDMVPKSADDQLYLPADAHPYTRRDLKMELLRRPCFEQVPILRCSSHRAAAPATLAGAGDVFRNETVEGVIYWSHLYWEQLWLDDVPYCERDANVMFGLKGPPFYTNLAPSVPQALDLRKWSCAFGDVVWWWTYPCFEEGANSQKAANLRPFFQEKHGRVMVIAGTEWWINGLVQLQGCVIPKGQSPYTGPGMEAFAWEKTGAKIGRAITGASWLQGTVWPAKPGETAGWLVWHFADDFVERTPIVYGADTARFWAEPSQINAERGFPTPVWKYHETKEEVLKERWLRLYRQDWTNPRPDVGVTSVDFVSNRACSASPFLIALNLRP